MVGHGRLLCLAAATLAHRRPFNVVAEVIQSHVPIAVVALAVRFIEALVTILLLDLADRLLLPRILVGRRDKLLLLAALFFPGFGCVLIHRLIHELLEVHLGFTELTELTDLQN